MFFIYILDINIYFYFLILFEMMKLIKIRWEFIDF